MCDQFNSECDWGRAVQVSPNLVFVAEPSQGGVLVIDVGAVQSVGNAVGVIETCKNITQLEYVPYTDQVWMRCEVGQRNSFIVIENASRGGGEYKGIQFPYAVLNGPLPVKISQVYLPSHSDGNRAQKDCQFGYARSLPDEQALRRMELKRLTYQQSSYLNLTKFACIPNQVFFSLSCKFYQLFFSLSFKSRAGNVWFSLFNLLLRNNHIFCQNKNKMSLMKAFSPVPFPTLLSLSLFYNFRSIQA